MSEVEEKKTKYGVFILRRDNRHISVIETEEYDKAYEVWEELNEAWIKSLKDNIPLKLTTPIVTAFDPGLIFEINLNPVVETTASRNANPYHQKMQKEGFSNSFGSNGILDGGYS